jgi:hypothetical protein
MIQLTFCPAMAVGSNSNVFFSGIPSDAAGPVAESVTPTLMSANAGMAMATSAAPSAGRNVRTCMEILLASIELRAIRAAVGVSRGRLHRSGATEAPMRANKRRFWQRRPSGSTPDFDSTQEILHRKAEIALTSGFDLVAMLAGTSGERRRAQGGTPAFGAATSSVRRVFRAATPPPQAGRAAAEAAPGDAGD